MPNVTRSSAASLMTVLLVAPLSGQARRQPNLSGHWTLVEALASGSARGVEGSSASPRPTTVNTISGAAFNCGRECTIVQEEQSLTIGNAQLAEYAGRDKSRPTPAVTLQLNGREASVVDSFSPDRELPVTAKWQAATLLIETRSTSRTVSQSVSLKDSQLFVVIVDFLNGERMSEVTLKYAKK